MSSVAPPEKQWYDLNCHCRATKLRVKIPRLYPDNGGSNEEGGEKYAVTNCNCSICTKHGYLFVCPDVANGEVEWVSGKCPYFTPFWTWYRGKERPTEGYGDNSWPF